MTGIFEVRQCDSAAFEGRLCWHLQGQTDCDSAALKGILTGIFDLEQCDTAASKGIFTGICELQQSDSAALKGIFTGILELKQCDSAALKGLSTRIFLLKQCELATFKISLLTSSESSSAIWPLSRPSSLGCPRFKPCDSVDLQGIFTCIFKFGQCNSAALRVVFGGVLETGSAAGAILGWYRGLRYV